MAGPSPFHAYDIRGVYGENLDEALMEKIGRAVVVHLKASVVLVGHDMRTSSTPLEAALIKGITEQGADVIKMGLCSTPMFYWAAQKHRASVMVTASHNPAKYNGAKICKNGAVPVGEISGLKEIEALVQKNEFPASERTGEVTNKEVLDAFIDFNLQFLHTDKQFTVVIDAANGMGGYTYEALIKKLPKSITIIPMFFELDGNFPNHEANPLKRETLTQLKERVLQEKADLGVSLDGDGDRLVFVDEKGEDIPSDITTALIAEQVLSEKPGATILYDIRQSRVAPEEITKAGGKAVMSRVGHAFIKLQMKEQEAAFAGELSGHFYNIEQQDTENTQLVFFRMLNLIAQEGKPLSEIAGPLVNRYAKIEETNFQVEDKAGMIAQLKETYGQDATAVSEVDGIRLDFADWWFNVRMSNTEPLLRLNMEANTKELLDEKVKELTAIITA
ncbi:MAG: phosphomannomutase/phosphoglucomutase [Candidatus Woesearchaeota archaeon]|nr:phosphomannomutase/phosphoglucomutase [Candidatus Woesearchaeota archaeon]